MRLEISDARALIERCFVVVGQSTEEAATIADQVIDIELRGPHFGGFSRALSMCGMILASDRRPVRVIRETPVSVLIDGGDNVGYVVAHRATHLAIAKAQRSGIGFGAANNTFYTGQFSYYAEMATSAGLVAIAMGASGPSVAPFGASEGRFGTNPIAFGIPAQGDPIIVDIGTSAAMMGDVTLAARTGARLKPGVAFDRAGEPTLDPHAALDGGAIAPWGGHKGSGLAMAMQMLGIMIGAATDSVEHRNSGYMVIVIDPSTFIEPERFKEEVRAYATTIEDARPLDPHSPPRLPFARSAAERRRRLAEGYIDVPDGVYDHLLRIARGNPSAALEPARSI